MYLSRISIDAKKPDALRLVSSPYRIHAAVERSFAQAGRKPTHDGRVLWRLDVPAGGRGGACLYVVSPEEPTLSDVSRQLGWQEGDHWEARDYDPLLNRLRSGQTWAFRLKANPARKVLVDKGHEANSRVMGTIQGHVTEQQQIDWLLVRSETHGFRIMGERSGAPMVRVSHRDKSSFLRAGDTVTLVTAVFDGVLEVTDDKVFREALCRGIGRAKGFGCGLMTVAPVPYGI